MSYKVLKQRFLLCGLGPLIDFESEEYENYKKQRGLYINDSWERVKVIFSKDDYGNLHPELENAIEMAELGCLTGGLIGGIIYSISRTQDFIANNDTNVFHNRNDALRKLSTQSMLGFGKGAFMLAPKIGILLGGFTLFSSCYEAYTNKSGIIPYTVGCSGIISLLRFNYGIRGMISGGIIGAVFGTLFGIAKLGIEKVLGLDNTQLKYCQFAFQQYRKQIINKSFTFGEEKNETRAGLTPHVKNPLNALED